MKNSIFKPILFVSVLLINTNLALAGNSTDTGLSLRELKSSYPSLFNNEDYSNLYCSDYNLCVDYFNRINKDYYALSDEERALVDAEDIATLTDEERALVDVKDITDILFEEATVEATVDAKDITDFPLDETKKVSFAEYVKEVFHSRSDLESVLKYTRNDEFPEGVEDPFNPDLTDNYKIIEETLEPFSGSFFSRKKYLFPLNNGETFNENDLKQIFRLGPISRDYIKHIKKLQKDEEEYQLFLLRDKYKRENPRPPVFDITNPSKVDLIQHIGVEINDKIKKNKVAKNVDYSLKGNYLRLQLFSHNAAKYSKFSLEFIYDYLKDALENEDMDDLTVENTTANDIENLSKLSKRVYKSYYLKLDDELYFSHEVPASKIQEFTNELQGRIFVTTEDFAEQFADTLVKTGIINPNQEPSEIRVAKDKARRAILRKTKNKGCFNTAEEFCKDFIDLVETSANELEQAIGNIQLEDIIDDPDTTINFEKNSTDEDLLLNDFINDWTKKHRILSQETDKYKEALNKYAQSFEDPVESTFASTNFGLKAKSRNNAHANISATHFNVGGHFTLGKAKLGAEIIKLNNFDPSKTDVSFKNEVGQVYKFYSSSKLFGINLNTQIVTDLNKPLLLALAGAKEPEKKAKGNMFELLEKDVLSANKPLYLSTDRSVQPFSPSFFGFNYYMSPENHLFSFYNNSIKTNFAIDCSLFVTTFIGIPSRALNDDMTENDILQGRTYLSDLYDKVSDNEYAKDPHLNEFINTQKLANSYIKPSLYRVKARSGVKVIFDIDSKSQTIFRSIFDTAHINLGINKNLVRHSNFADIENIVGFQGLSECISDIQTISHWTTEANISLSRKIRMFDVTAKFNYSYSTKQRLMDESPHNYSLSLFAAINLL